MNIEGKLIEKFETQNVSGSFKKREFVIEFAENPQYPELIKMELVQNNCQQLDDITVGDNISVAFNLKGRKWTDPKGEVKYFTSIQAWRVEKKSDGGGSTSEGESSWINSDFSQDNDLPF